MGDRTSVTLTVLECHSEAVEKVFSGFYSKELITKARVNYLFEEVNYGALRALPELQKQGIAYDSAWAWGSEYEPGTEYLRFTSEGVAVEKCIYQYSRNPDIGELLLAIDSPQKLREVVLKKIEENTVLPWDMQAEYGRIYRVMQLLQG